MWIFFGIAGGLLFYFVLPNWKYRKKEILPSEKPVLTFDDGPTEVTEEVLDILKDYSIQGYFFVLGEKALQRPKLIRRMKEEGHIVGLHAYIHRHGALILPHVLWKDLRKGYEALMKLGIEPKFYRPTHGFYTAISCLFSRMHGMKNFHWYALMRDWEKNEEGVVAKRLGKASAPGRILVLHDGCEGSADPKAYQKMPEELRNYLKESSFFKKNLRRSGE